MHIKSLPPMLRSLLEESLLDGLRPFTTISEDGYTMIITRCHRELFRQVMSPFQLGSCTPASRRRHAPACTDMQMRLNSRALSFDYFYDTSI